MSYTRAESDIDSRGNDGGEQQVANTRAERHRKTEGGVAETSESHTCTDTERA